MAAGDIPDLVRRLRAALPRRWFPDDYPVLNGVLTGCAAAWNTLWTVLQYVITQTRIKTATGIFLDIAATDFFQGRITRNLSEPDRHFRTRILAEILRPRATRGAVDQALFDLTGVHPDIFEPANTSDTGGYNVGGIGYDVAGGWGDLNLPFQAFITAFRPAGGGIANVSGYGNIAVGIATTGGLGGYGQGAIEWADLDMVFGAVTDADIYATVAAAMPAASIGWTRGLAATASQLPPTLLPSSGFSRSLSSARATFTVVAGVLLQAIGRAKSLGQATVSVGITNAIGAGAAGLAAARGANAGLLMTLTSASGSARAFGQLLAGNVAIFNGRGKGQSVGRATPPTLAAKTSARGQAKAIGRSTVSLQQAAPTAPTLVASDATASTMTLTWTASTGAP